MYTPVDLSTTIGNTEKKKKMAMRKGMNTRLLEEFQFHPSDQ
jgi:hypothetical protein